MFEKSDVENMLKNYLLNRAQLQEVNKKIEKNNVLINYNRTKYKASEEEVIESMSLKSPTSEMPNGKTNKINKMTEIVALNYQEHLIAHNRFNVIDLKIENERYFKKKFDLEDKVEKVDRMLRALNNEQKLVIKSYYFYDQKWNIVQDTYSSVYKTQALRTVNQLKNIRDNAIEKMLKVINI